MSAPLTPGAYLKHRRQAAQLSVADVATRITTDPRSAEHERGEWLDLIEADAAPMTLTTIVALRRVFRFDLDVLMKLEAIAQGATIPHPALCRICACSDRDPCPMPGGGGCYWIEGDMLCAPCALAIMQ